MPRAEDLQRALEHLRVQREQEDRERVETASGDVSENEDGILLVPVSVYVCRIGVIAVVSLLRVALKGGTRLMGAERRRVGSAGSCSTYSLCRQ